MKIKKMRRKDREIQIDEAKELLSKGEYGILSTVGPKGQPYGVPLNYTFKNNCIYFHCAIEGHKIENIENNPKVSFCVVGKTKILPEEFATEYESAVAFGVASQIQGIERQSALVWLLEKYSADYLDEGKEYIQSKDKVTKVIKIKVDHISGKARK